MTSHGQRTKETEAFSSRQDHHLLKCDVDGLRNVVQRLSLTGDKIANEGLKKVVIADILHPTSQHNIVPSEEEKDLLVAAKPMKKSLRMVVKNGERKATCTPGRKKLESRWKVNGAERAQSAVTMTCLSSVSCRSGSAKKRTEQTKKASANESTKHRLQGAKFHKESVRNVYSRHANDAQNNTRGMPELDSSENGDCTSSNYSAGLDFESTSSSFGRMRLKRCYQGSKHVISTDLPGENCSTSGTQTPQEDISNDRKVLNSLIDKQLKESLKKIIKRRKSSVRFVRCESGCDVISIGRTISEQQEIDPENYNEPNKFAENSGTENIPSNRGIPSVTTRRIPEIPQFSSSARTQLSGKFGLSEDDFWQTQWRIRSSASHRRLSNWKKHNLNTGEERVIRPALAKGYVPNLANKKDSSKRLTISSPTFAVKKQRGRCLTEENIIREFLLTYAKVSTESKHDQADSPVGMISQAPELVIKSAIGQFLTSTFPSGKILSGHEPKVEPKMECLEEQQRCKLLRIKLCMKHLAALA